MKSEIFVLELSYKYSNCGANRKQEEWLAQTRCKQFENYDLQDCGAYRGWTAERNVGG